MSSPAMILAQLVGADRRRAAEASPAVVAQALARFWTDTGVAAHTAMQAGAELAAHLLRLDAPAPLLHGAARALLDETAISGACLELARAHGAVAVELPIAHKRDAALDLDFGELVLGTLRRGCIAATVDSSCAREALEHCHEPGAREVLLQIRHGRARTAQLSWRFLGWALRGPQGGNARPSSAELADQVRVAVLTLLGTPAAPAPLPTFERQLLRHGVLGPGQRLAIEQRVLREVVLPCMESALSRRGESSPSENLPRAH